MLPQLHKTCFMLAVSHLQQAHCAPAEDLVGSEATAVD